MQDTQNLTQDFVTAALLGKSSAHTSVFAMHLWAKEKRKNNIMSACIRMKELGKDPQETSNSSQLWAGWGRGDRVEGRMTRTDGRHLTVTILCFQRLNHVK